MTYLMMPLELVFVVEIAASADQSYSVIEARDLMFEAFVAYLLAVNFAAVANFAVATVQAVIEFVRSIAAVVAVVPTADPGNQNFNFLQLNQQDPKPVAAGEAMVAAEDATACVGKAATDGGRRCYEVAPLT
ncbi:hypothetical protein U1Q18_029046 [Sarracenia purpurea var. burkii]